MEWVSHALDAFSGAAQVTAAILNHDQMTVNAMARILDDYRATDLNHIERVRLYYAHGIPPVVSAALDARAVAVANEQRRADERELIASPY